MMKTVCEAAQSHDFSLHDQYNITKFTGECQKQIHCNWNIIVKRNQKHAANYANEYQELQDFNFSQVSKVMIYYN